MRSTVSVYEVGSGQELCGHLAHTQTDPWVVEVTIPSRDVRVVAEGDSLFRALVSIREELDAKALLLGVNGSRLDVYPTYMIEDATGGRLAYLLSTPRLSNHGPHEAVDIFGPAPLAKLASVAAQAGAALAYNLGGTPWPW